MGQSDSRHGGEELSVRMGQSESKHGQSGSKHGGEELSVRMGQSESKHGGGRGVEIRAGDVDRVLVWEVSIARGCLHSFNRILLAHAIIFTLLAVACFLGYLAQLNVNPERSNALLIFSLANSIALYTATAGLLFSIYCIIAGIITLHPVPLPDRFDDPLSVDLLHNLRSYLRHIALPAMTRRCKFLSSTLAICLIFCIIAHISSGIAAIHPADRLIGVTLPAIPGGFVLLFLLLLGASKLNLELDFDTRFRKLWATMAPHKIYQPEIRILDKDTTHALDPLPYFLSWIRSE